MSEKIKKSSVSIGADPELFLVDKQGNAVSAIGKIPGNKSKPFNLVDIGEGFALQTDCCSVEFNVPPVKFLQYNSTILGAEEMYNNIERVIAHIRAIIPAGLDISYDTSKEFTEEDLKHPQAREAGCSADYNAWALCQNEKPNFKATNIRCNGAHLHFGYDGHNDVTSIELIKALDLTLGVTSIIIDTDTERRKLYGKAGCFRMTPFGIEYRTPSPYWLQSIEMIRHVFRAINVAVDLVNSGKIYSDVEQMDIQTCINVADVDMAWQLIDKYKLSNILPAEVLLAC